MQPFPAFCLSLLSLPPCVCDARLHLLFFSLMVRLVLSFSLCLLRFYASLVRLPHDASSPKPPSVSSARVYVSFISLMLLPLLLPCLVLCSPSSVFSSARVYLLFFPFELLSLLSLLAHLLVQLILALITAKPRVARLQPVPNDCSEMIRSLLELLWC